MTTKRILDSIKRQSVKGRLDHFQLILSVGMPFFSFESLLEYFTLFKKETTRDELKCL